MTSLKSKSLDRLTSFYNDLLAKADKCHKEFDEVSENVIKLLKSNDVDFSEANGVLSLAYKYADLEQALRNRAQVIANYLDAKSDKVDLSKLEIVDC